MWRPLALLACRAGRDVQLKHFDKVQMTAKARRPLTQPASTEVKMLRCLFIFSSITYAFYQMSAADFFFLFHKGPPFGQIPRTQRNDLHMPTVRHFSKARRAEKWQFNLCTDTLARRKEGCQKPEGKCKCLNNVENNDGEQKGELCECVCGLTMKSGYF